jgi:GxxExxY protein
MGIEPAAVRYRDRVIGRFATDPLVADRVIVEVKVAAGLHRDFDLQCVDYLRSTGLNVCLLLNFGRGSLEFRRGLILA